MKKADAPDDKWLHYNLVLFVGKAVAPKADGVPYEKGAR